MKTTTTVKQHTRKTEKSGTVTVAAHNRSTYKPTGRFGAYCMAGYENMPHYKAYVNYDEDPLNEGEGYFFGNMNEPVFMHLSDAIGWAEYWNEIFANPTSKEFKKMQREFEADELTPEQINWGPTTGMKMAYLKSSEERATYVVHMRGTSLRGCGHVHYTLESAKGCMKALKAGDWKSDAKDIRILDRTTFTAVK
jgi:hypothetical protein